MFFPLILAAIFSSATKPVIMMLPLAVCLSVKGAAGLNLSTNGIDYLILDIFNEKKKISKSRACIPTLLRTARTLPLPHSLPASGFTETQNGHLVSCV